MRRRMSRRSYGKKRGRKQKTYYVSRGGIRL
jgi:hypothetical protein